MVGKFFVFTLGKHVTSRPSQEKKSANQDMKVNKYNKKDLKNVEAMKEAFEELCALSRSSYSAELEMLSILR